MGPSSCSRAMALNGPEMAQRMPLQAKAGSTRPHTLRFSLTPTLILGDSSLPCTLREALARGLLALWASIWLEGG